ncbi:MAG: hypothetical protein HW398_895, partial [Acidobacteria bacterium]|nr:hypothetical protein [Acidobacteriota bacterium]
MTRPMKSPDGSGEFGIPLHTIQLHRRAFISSCGALMLALSGCQSVLSRTRLAGLALNDPHPDDYGRVLGALIETILPFGDPRFPRISAAAIQARFLALFSLEETEKYLVFQKGLMIFNRIDLFPVLQAPMVSEQRALLDPGGSRRGTAGAAIAEMALQDQRIYAAFRRTSLASGARSFTALQPLPRAEYLRLWGQSGFNGKQLFYH